MLKLFLLVCLTVNALVDSIPIEQSVIKGRILGGNNTDISQVPYQVAVLINGYFSCGGFIVSPTHIVTSAECVFLLEDFEFIIRAGSTSFKKGGVTTKVKQIHVHPKYAHSIEDYDVSVIELATPLKLDNKTMKAIKLAATEPSAGSSALVSGWGATDDQGNPIETLKSVTLPIYSRTKCEADFKPHNISITPRMICAFAEEKATELGDSGGPLVYKDEAVGIISIRHPWTHEDMPSVFTNIAHPEVSKFIKDIAKL